MGEERSMEQAVEAPAEETQQDNAVQADADMLRELEELKAENENLKAENKKWRDMSFSEAKASLYDKIPLTVGQMDIIIWSLVGLAILFVVLGMR